MSNQKIIRIFIGSPSEVKEERRLTEEAIYDLSSKFENLFGIALVPVNWKKFRPYAASGEEKTVGTRITRRLEKSALFVGIFSNTYGMGTHDELKFVLSNRDRVKILTYFGSLSPATDRPDDLDQRYKLKQLKKELLDMSVLYDEYQNIEEFKKKIVLDLMEAVLEMTNEIRRKENLSRFFRFGSAKQPEPSVLIGYPPIFEIIGIGIESHYDWSFRLVPNIVYEDFKAIQHIEEALRHLGINDYEDVTIPNPKLKEPGNKIWVCIPRNDIAKKYLKNLGERVKFKFEVTNDDSKTRYILWNQDKEKEIIITSPLSNYLKLQRKNKDKWNYQYGHNIAKDYAIVARFAETNTPFYHYFVGGLRGLGTWGAGWYINNCHEELSKIALINYDSDIQILLEVTFQDYRIKNITDVSNMKQEYFNLNNSEQYIRDIIENN